MVAQDEGMKSFSGEKLVEEGKYERKASFTLIELLVVVGLLSVIAFLVYPAYLSSSRSYELSDVKTSLQQNARLGMKKMVVSLQEGMVVDVSENDNDWDPSGNNAYKESEPYFIIFYLWDTTPDVLTDNEQIAIYAALLDDPDTTEDESKNSIDPAAHSLPPDYDLPDTPSLYMRRYTSYWSDPEPLILSNVKVTQLNFILGGDNEDKVLITLELAREGPSKEWRTYKLVSAVKLGAR